MNLKNIPIVFSADEKYLFPACVAIYSLLKNAENKELEIYILTDCRYSDEGLICISKLQNTFPMAGIQIISIERALFKDAVIKSNYISLATMYRLKLSSILKDDSYCLYIDTDVLVLGDIGELIEIDIRDYFCAGVLDNEAQIGVTQKKELQIPDMYSYVNAGVLLMNLELMREVALEDAFMYAIDKGYPLQDQGIINKCCYGKIKLIDKKYNCYSRESRYPEDVCILHFAGGPDVHPWENRKTKNDSMWWEYADFFKDTLKYAEQVAETEQYSQARDYRYIYDRCKSASKVYIWGYMSRACYLAKFLIEKGIGHITAFIDSSMDKKGYIFENIPVLQPSELEIEDNILIINTAYKRKNEIDEQILSMGLKKNNIVQYCEKTDYYYRVLDGRYYAPEIEDLMMLRYWVAVHPIK